MADDLTLTDPLPAPTVFRVASIRFDIRMNTIRIDVQEAAGGVLIENGKVYPCGYDGAEAKQLMQFLNTANLSTVSLQKRILQKLTTDGQLPAGSVS